MRIVAHVDDIWPEIDWPEIDWPEIDCDPAPLFRALLVLRALLGLMWAGPLARFLRH